jgi:hypothetical protein
VNNVSFNIILLILIMLGGTAALFLFRFLGRRRRDRVFAEEAAARGWRYESVGRSISRPGSAGFRSSGVTGDRLAWTMETYFVPSNQSDMDGGGSSTYFTRWWSEAISLPDRLVLIGPHMPVVGSLPATLEGGGLGGSLVRLFLHRIFGADADRLGGMSEVQVGSESLRKRYMVYAHSLDDARKLLGRGVESALLDWPARRQLAIKLGGSELSILLPGLQVTEIDQAEEIVDLGVRLATAWQSQLTYLPAEIDHQQTLTRVA